MALLILNLLFAPFPCDTNVDFAKRTVRLQKNLSVCVYDHLCLRDAYGKRPHGRVTRWLHFDKNWEIRTTAFEFDYDAHIKAILRRHPDEPEMHLDVYFERGEVPFLLGQIAIQRIRANANSSIPTTIWIHQRTH